jgi:predicted acyl esterase
MRGSGDSDGILYDEYLPQEQDDALEVLAWIAAQPWCDGNIGMHGISWGGFNSLQVAARRPPQLKAIIAIGATDDRYHDDVHYMGGCLLTSQMLPWASLMFAYNPSPPDPRWVGDKWRRCGWSGWNSRRRTSKRGWNTRRAMRTGNTAPSAKITPTSRFPSTWSAAGPTATTTPFRA